MQQHGNKRGAEEGRLDNASRKPDIAKAFDLEIEVPSISLL